VKRLLIVGAGPMGLAAGLGALERGFEVTLLEAERVGHALRQWGSARFFSPLGMNLSGAARAALGERIPADDVLLTGPEMADAVLEPIARGPLGGRVREGHRVVSIARSGLTRLDLPGHPLRAERTFRVLAETPEGETTLEAEVLLDASGVTGRPNFLGPGGMPARGERAAGSRVTRSLGALEATLARARGKHLLLIGHGHSAATAVLRLADLAREEPATHVTWAVRSRNRRPCEEVAGDPLPERHRVAAGANDLAENPPAFLSVERRATVECLDAEGERVRVRFSGERGGEFDEVYAFTGYRPDLTFLSELALDLSPVTQGAAGLARALGNVTDCLSVPRIAPRDLASGEPGFFLVGAKSYGRSRTFLLRTGLAQLETIFDSLN
jgi:thioredoxin reductase